MERIPTSRVQGLKREGTWRSSNICFQNFGCDELYTSVLFTFVQKETEHFTGRKKN